MLETNVETPPKEGKVAKTIEHRTSHLPSDLFLWTALGFLGASAIVQGMSGREGSGRNVPLLLAQLAPTFLILGLYNKIVKLSGSDRQDPGYSTPSNPTFGA